MLPQNQNQNQRRDLMMTWAEVYRQVEQKLQHFAESAPTSLWREVFREALNRWRNRSDIINGEVGKEVTITVDVPDDYVAGKMLQRIAEFSQQFARLETDDAKVIVLGQRYKKDGDLSVLLRIRIAAKTQKNRRKFVATSADEV
jgi:hypothetical protein